jgi:hypothetical protein
MNLKTVVSGLAIPLVAIETPSAPTNSASASPLSHAKLNLVRHGTCCEPRQLTGKAGGA